MTRLSRLGAVAIAALVLVALAVAVGSQVLTAEDKPAAAQAASHDEREHEKSGERSETGPPPWSHHAGSAHDKSWKVAWKAMSPEDRGRTMRRLATQHAAGMRAWTRCMASGAGDCQRPLPPGLAKKRLTP